MRRALSFRHIGNRPISGTEPAVSDGFPIRGSIAPTDRFRSAVQDAKIGPDKDIPHVTPQVIVKYITDLQLLGLL